MNTIFTSSKLYQGCVKPHINVLPPQMHGGVSRVSSFSARPTNLMEHNNGSKRSLVVNSGSSIRPEGPKRRRSESIGVLKQPIPFKKASWWSANPLVGQQQQTQNPKDDTSIPTTPRFPARNQAVLQIFDIPASNRINSLHESIMHPPATIHVPSQPSTLSALQHPDEAQRESGGNLPSPKGHSSDDDCSATSSSNDNALNFRAYQAENWTEKFEELLRFRSEHGHCLVPNSFDEKPFLAQWVKRRKSSCSFPVLLPSTDRSIDR